MNKHIGIAALFLATFVAAVATGVLTSSYEYITYLNVPAQVQQNTSANASFQVVVNGTNATEYPALYGKPINGTTWHTLCSWANFSYPSGYGNKTFACSAFVDAPVGNYTVRATVHTNGRTGCSNETYTPEPFDGCGDYEDKIVSVVS